MSEDKSEFLTVWFCPQSDITAYELAIIFSNISVDSDTMRLGPEIMIGRADWEDMPEELKRHFTDAPDQ